MLLKGFKKLVVINLVNIDVNIQYKFSLGLYYISKFSKVLECILKCIYIFVVVV